MERCEAMNREEIKRKLQPGKVQIQRGKQKPDSNGERDNKYRNKNTKLTTQQRLMLNGMMPVIIQDIPTKN